METRLVSMVELFTVVFTAVGAWAVVTMVRNKIRRDSQPDDAETRLMARLDDLEQRLKKLEP